MKPIIFNTPMVQAILDGRKTQTRRIIKPQPAKEATQFERFIETVDCGLEARFGSKNSSAVCDRKPQYKPGNILWVRETWATVSSGIIEYKATYIEPYTGSTEIDHIGKKITWRPSIHMPREAARIFLLLTNVRVERVQDITDADILAEGFECREDFIVLWNILNEKEVMVGTKTIGYMRTLLKKSVGKKRKGWRG